MSRIIWLANRVLQAAAIVVACAGFSPAKSNDQTFALSDTQDLVLLNVKAKAVEYKGRKAVRLTKDVTKDGFALLRGSDFQDGTIEADIALKLPLRRACECRALSASPSARGQTLHATNSSTCGRETPTQRIKPCAIMSSNTRPSRTSAGTNFAANGLGFTSPTRSCRQRLGRRSRLRSRAA